jgi:hypothetical protein
VPITILAFFFQLLETGGMITLLFGGSVKQPAQQQPGYKDSQGDKEVVSIMDPQIREIHFINLYSG